MSHEMVKPYESESEISEPHTIFEQNNGVKKDQVIALILNKKKIIRRWKKQHQHSLRHQQQHRRHRQPQHREHQHKESLHRQQHHREN
ncbi:unnamed protein product [Brachionus calyciflorus]|uniref:Uncharacterized protein n=1 Tax=Brachionus calyciflorus TaxID=104777 RepID=A0A814FWK2_9BILA|nr:unnamed protein product [Brachionus calyciflorus]